MRGVITQKKVWPSPKGRAFFVSINPENRLEVLASVGIFALEHYKDIYSESWKSPVALVVFSRGGFL